MSEAKDKTVSVTVSNPEGNGQILTTCLETDLLSFFTNISDRAQNVLYPQKKSHNITNVALIIDDQPGIAHCTDFDNGNKNIHLSSKYIQRIYDAQKKGALLFEIEGVLYHEMIHVYQNDGKSFDKPVPPGIIEGIADYFRLLANFSPRHWKETAGGDYNDGYEKTAYFLRWINNKFSANNNNVDFVVWLNEKIGVNGWDEDYFSIFTTKGLDDLWDKYQTTLPGYSEGIPANFTITPISTFETLENIDFHFDNQDIEHPGSRLLISCFNIPTDLLKSLSAKVVVSLYSFPPTNYPSFINSVKLIVRDMPGVAYCTGTKRKKEVHISAGYIESNFIKNGANLEKLEKEIRGVLIHELTHVFQWSEKIAKNCKDRKHAPGGITEGVADWVRLTNSLGASHWQRSFKNWDEGYSGTAFFLEWIEGLDQGKNFVRVMNYYLACDGWDVMVFEKVLGLDVMSLWKIYCAKFKPDGVVGDSMEENALPSCEIGNDGDETENEH